MQMAVSFLEHPLYKKFLELKCDRRVVTHFWPLDPSCILCFFGLTDVTLLFTAFF